MVIRKGTSREHPMGEFLGLFWAMHRRKELLRQARNCDHVVDQWDVFNYWMAEKAKKHYMGQRRAWFRMLARVMAG